MENFAGVRIDLGFDAALDQARQYAPDLLVCEAFDFVGPMVAAALDLPWAVHAVSAGLPEPLIGALRERSAAQHLVRGLRPRERFALIDPVPDVLRLADDPPPPGDRIVVRPSRTKGDHTAGSGPELPDGRPVVLVSAGTSVRDRDLLAGLAASVADAGYQIVVTAEPGTLPADPRVHAVGFVPFARLLPAVDAVVGTGGLGTVLATLATGLPMALRPVLADQPWNAQRVATAGAGISIEDPAGAGPAVRTVLADPAYRAAAQAAKEGRRHMKVNGRHLAVEINGAGPALVFLHGIGGTSNVHQVQADVLSSAHQVIRPDFAGAGRSPVADGISIGSHAEDVAAILDALGAGPAIIVAHSMGTLVARTLAARHPGKVAALALLGAVQPPDDAGRAAILDRAAVLRAEGTAAIASAIVSRSLSPATRSRHPEIAAFVRELVMRQNPEGYARNNEALAAATDPGPISSGLPLLLVAGRDDMLSPRGTADRIATAHGGAEVQVIDDIGHWIPLEDARRTTELLSAFVSRREWRTTPLPLRAPDGLN